MNELARPSGQSISSPFFVAGQFFLSFFFLGHSQYTHSLAPLLFQSLTQAVTHGAVFFPCFAKLYFWVPSTLRPVSPSPPSRSPVRWVLKTIVGAKTTTTTPASPPPPPPSDGRDQHARRCTFKKKRSRKREGKRTKEGGGGEPEGPVCQGVAAAAAAAAAAAEIPWVAFSALLSFLPFFLVPLPVVCL